MLFLKIIGTVFVALVAVNVIKSAKPEYARFITLCAGAGILIVLSDYIAQAVGVFQGLAEKSGLGSAVFSSVLKIIGIGYVTEYASNVCDDNNVGSLGKKIELAGKLTIFVMAIPILSGIIDVIGKMI